MCSYDAKSCYDRMGVKEPPIFCVFITIQNL
jgi:hypothetical protein